jgi:hypothetical protein
MRFLAGLLWIVAASSALAQTPARVTGRLVDRTTGLPIGNGNVRLDNGPVIVVGADGSFRLEGTPGRHTLDVRALGYAPGQHQIDLGGDSTIVIDLEPRPFTLDTVRAESRTVKAKTTIRDSSSRILLADVEVTTNTGERKSSGHTGLITVDVPVRERTYLFFTAFGYLPRLDSLSLERDTSFTVWLRTDPIAARMIDQQTAKLAERIKGRRAAGKSTLTRKEAMSGSDGGMYTVLQREGFLQRLGCLVIDDVQQGDNYGSVPTRAALEGLLPDRVERVERASLANGVRMVRIYTRDYVRDMMAGRVALRPIGSSLAGGRIRCW